MKTLQYVVVLPLLLAVQCLGASAAGLVHGKPTPAEVEQARATLHRVKVFAFREVGSAGAISEGEKAFRTVLGSPNALASFVATLRTGSCEGKLYALCGIRTLGGYDFGALCDAAARLDLDVETLLDGLTRREKFAAVVKRIAKGDYNKYL